MSHDYWVAAKSRGDIENLANAWRGALGVPPDCKAPDLLNILENELPNLFSHFALVVKADGQMSGAEGYTEFDPPKIVLAESTYLDTARYGGRGRWTAAHEIGHLVQHDSAVPIARAQVTYFKLDYLPKPNSAEWQANAFAAAFLMPSDLVRDYVDAGEIASFFSVSRQAAEIRLKQLDIRPRRIIPGEVQATIRRLNGEDIAT